MNALIWIVIEMVDNKNYNNSKKAPFKNALLFKGSFEHHSHVSS